ncbi:hypothetical protein VYU27_003564 [Nannochloropsis oceanica]
MTSFPALLLLLLPCLAASFLILPRSATSSSGQCPAARVYRTTCTTRRRAATTRRAATPRPSTFCDTFNGGWAGWECHFSLASGHVLPVPAEDLPEALREWEVEMWGWEGTSYDNVREEEGEKEEKMQMTFIDRKAARFMVEAGCGCENVGKQKSQAHLGPLHLAPHGAGYLATDRLTSSFTRLEVAFSSSNSSSSSPTEQTRARILIDLHTTSFPSSSSASSSSSSSSSPSSPPAQPTTTPRDILRVHLERRFTPFLPLDPDEQNDPFKKSIDQTTISRRVVVPCFGDPEAKAAGRQGEGGLGKSGAWVAWEKEGGVLEVGWRPEMSMYGGESCGVEEMVCRATLNMATGEVKACEWGKGTK